LLCCHQQGRSGTLAVAKVAFASLVILRNEGSIGIRFFAMLRMTNLRI
jgi:hypothetical protein